MKGKFFFSRALLVCTILTTLLMSAPAQMLAQSAGNLQFAPLAVLAPDDNQIPGAGPYACVDPDGNPRSTMFHCYTPSDIYAAYG
ncbi:MAG: hypothetical protein ACM3XO_25030, partial [Bacteroidota bacterium]